MASEYKIIYTYKGQSNTSRARSVKLSSFEKTGDVDRNIRQITSITYEHWHTSTKPMTWALRGRLVLADGTTIVSDEDKHGISGNEVKFTNTFSNLPTAEQFAQVQVVETIDPKDSTGDSGYSAQLYWRATSAQPMRIIVTFIEEPPVHYAPKIEEFKVIRCDEKGEPDDEGIRVKTDLEISIGDPAGLQGASLRIYYAQDTLPIVGESYSFDLSSQIPALLSGVYDSFELIPNDREWDLKHTYNFVAVFIAGEEFDAAEPEEQLHRAICSLHVSGQSGGGICVCGYSKGTEDKPMFESHAEGFFYAGIHGVTNYVPGEVKTGGRWIDGKEIYRYVMVAQSALDGGAGVIGQMPSAIENLISASGTMKGTDGSVRPIPYAYYGNDTYTVCYYIDASGAINFQIGSGYSGTNTIILVLEYTKA